MEQSAAAILAECLKSWRRGPYPQSTSFVSALSVASDGECRWMNDVNNIVDLAGAMEALTYRQREVLYRFVVMGDGQAALAGVLGITQSVVSTELEIAFKTLANNI